MAALPDADAVDLRVVVGEGTWCSRLNGRPHVLMFEGSARGGRGGAGGGAKPKGAKGGKKVIVEPHRHKGVFVARGGKEDLLATANLVPGESVYGEKRISVENAVKGDDAVATKTEYRVSGLSFLGNFRAPANPEAAQIWNPLSVSVLTPVASHADVDQPKQACGRYPRRFGDDLHEAWLKGALSGCGVGHVRVSRCRHCRADWRRLRV